MNSLHRQKDQNSYVCSEKEYSGIGGKSLLGIRYVSESLRGKVVSSKWLEHVDYDGTVYRLNTRVRVGVTATGKTFTKTDRTLIVRNVGEATRAEIAFSGTKLMHTTIGVVCMSCLTSDHIIDDKDGRGHTCTRCNSWIKGV